MVRTRYRPGPTRELYLTPVLTVCPACGHSLSADYHNSRTIITLDGVLRLTLQIRRCHQLGCARYRFPYRPEGEGRLVLPHHEFGLDIIVFAGSLRYAEQRSLREIYQELSRRQVAVSPRSVHNLLDRYDELRTPPARGPAGLGRCLLAQGQVILAVEGLQPDAGREVLWLVRDCLSGEILRARSLAAAAPEGVAGLLQEVRGQLPVPVAAVISDGRPSLRLAVAQVFPGIPHQLLQEQHLGSPARTA